MKPYFLIAIALILAGCSEGDRYDYSTTQITCNQYVTVQMSLEEYNKRRAEGEDVEMLDQYENQFGDVWVTASVCQDVLNTEDNDSDDDTVDVTVTGELDLDL